MITLLLGAASLVFGFKLIWYLVNHKRINRAKYFESQLTEVRSSRASNDLPSYRGKDYQRYLGSWTWKIISNLALQEMKGKCEFCANPAKAVHHVCYPNNRSDLGLEDISSLCVVCKKCHKVLHGNSHGQDKICALCGKVNASKNLNVVHNIFGSNKQRVCGRCYLIAKGFRDEANKLSWEQYTAWVGGWQKRLLDEMLLQRGRRNSDADKQTPVAAAKPITVDSVSPAIRDGHNFECAIPVSSVAEEYKWIANYFPDAITLNQTLVDHQLGLMDEIEIKLSDGSKRKIYFDIKNILLNS